LRLIVPGDLPPPTFIFELIAMARKFSCQADLFRKHAWIADAHRGDGKRFVVHADEKATAFLELERAICLRLLTEQI
jgi:hypothetical protein